MRHICRTSFHGLHEGLGTKGFVNLNFCCCLCEEDEELDVRDKGHTWDGEFSDSDSDSEGFEHHANHRALASSEPAFPRLSLLLYFSWPSSILVSLSVDKQKLLYKVSLKCIALLGLFIAGDFHSWLQ
jgi:hypothetical protein